jgi:hypothetical protein
MTTNPVHGALFGVAIGDWGRRLTLKTAVAIKPFPSFACY